jgi:hypothetical protein
MRRGLSEGYDGHEGSGYGYSATDKALFVWDYKLDCCEIIIQIIYMWLNGVTSIFGKSIQYVFLMANHPVWCCYILQLHHGSTSKVCSQEGSKETSATLISYISTFWRRLGSRTNPWPPQSHQD